MKRTIRILISDSHEPVQSHSCRPPHPRKDDCAFKLLEASPNPNRGLEER